MDRIITAVVLLSGGLIFPVPLYFPAYFSACVIVMFFFKVNFWKSIIKFLILWFLFFFVVGIGRFIAGINYFVLLKDCSFGLGLAISISCALLLIISDSPNKILLSCDRLKVSRNISYSLLSLLRLLPLVKSIGTRQLELLKLKTNINGSYAERFLAYPRILGPLFTILLTQQYTHSRSLTERKFFLHQSFVETSGSVIKSNVLFLIILLVINDFIWLGVWKWHP